jgi:hypothetical protein
LEAPTLANCRQDRGENQKRARTLAPHERRRSVAQQPISGDAGIDDRNGSERRIGLQPLGQGVGHRLFAPSITIPDTWVSTA